MATLAIFQVDVYVEPFRSTWTHITGLRDLFPASRPGGGGGFTLSINRSSSPGSNTRTFVLGGPGQADIGSDRVMPLAEYATATTSVVD